MTAERIDRAINNVVEKIMETTEGTPENYALLVTALLEQAATLVFAHHNDSNDILPDPTELSARIRQMVGAARAGMEQAVVS